MGKMPTILRSMYTNDTADWGKYQLHAGCHSGGWGSAETGPSGLCSYGVYSPGSTVGKLS